MDRSYGKKKTGLIFIFIFYSRYLQAKRDTENVISILIEVDWVMNMYLVNKNKKNKAIQHVIFLYKINIFL